MKPPRAYARGILHFFGVTRRSTLLRSPSFGGSPLRIYPWTYVHGLLRRRINCVKAEAMLNLRNEEKQSEADPHEGGRPHSDKQVAP